MDNNRMIADGAELSARMAARQRAFEEDLRRLNEALEAERRRERRSAMLARIGLIAVVIAAALSVFAAGIAIMHLAHA